jgi:eukaryotic-like serine/threonine-protein kinase
MTSAGPVLGARPVAPGDRIGRYLVIEPLGEGGMGVVVAAFDPSLDRKVAIKVLRPAAWTDGETANTTGRDRLLREARAMAKIVHPNVITVHEVGTFGDEVFVAMEFAGGGTLRSWMKQKGTRPWREVVAKFVEAGQGLAAAHQAELVHRDFKPENVLLTRDGLAKVGDFGLVGAGAAEVGNSDPFGKTLPAGALAVRIDQALTRTGELFGTPAYMAPEQMRGERAGPAADQFAFCVSLWEALYGERPIAGSSAVELCGNLLAGKVLDPQSHGDVPRWIHSVLRRGLRTKPEERWPSMAALLEALQADPSRALRARLTAVGIAVGVAVVAAALIWGFHWRSEQHAGLCRGAREEMNGAWNEARYGAMLQDFQATKKGYGRDTAERVRQRLDRYADAWVAARTQACEATRVRGEQSETLLDLRMHCYDRRLAGVRSLVDVLASTQDGAVVDSAVDAVTKLDSLSGCEDTNALLADVPLPANPAQRAKVDAVRPLLDRAKALEDTGEFKTGLDAAIRAADAADASGYAPAQGEAWYRRGNLERLTESLGAAEADLGRAVQLAAAAQDDLTAARAWIELMKVVGEMESRPVEGRVLESAAKAAVARAGKPADVSIRLLMNTASLRWAEGKFEEARGFDAEAAAQAERTLGEGHPVLAGALMNLGGDDLALGRKEECLENVTRAATLYESTLGPMHPYTIRSLSNTASILLSLGRYRESLQAARRVLERFAKAGITLSWDVATTQTTLGQALLALGNVAEAEEMATRAVETTEQQGGAEHPRIVRPLLGLARVELARGDKDAADRAATRAEALCEKVLGPRHLDTALALGRVGIVALERGDAARAKQAGERALAIYEGQSADPVDVAEARWVVARALAKQEKDKPRSKALAEQAAEAFRRAGPARAAELEAALRLLRTL